jgi:hypothetical protein
MRAQPGPIAFVPLAFENNVAWHRGQLPRRRCTFTVISMCRSFPLAFCFTATARATLAGAVTSFGEPG